MTDIRSDIIINVDTSIGIAEIKNLQRKIAELNAQLLKSGTAQAQAAQKIQRNLINNINATGQFAANVKTISSTAESFTTALERNKLGMGEYFRYAGGASKTFGKLFRQEFDTIQQVAESRVKTLQTQYIKLGRDANGALKAIAVRPLALDMENLATKTALAAQRQQLFNQLVQQGSTNLLNFGKNTQWAGRQLMVGFTIPLAMVASQAGKTFMQMEEQAIRFKRVYGDTFTPTSETEKMIEQIKELGGQFTKYGVQVEKTMKMAADAAAMGKTGADLLAQVRNASNLAVLGGVEQDQALETTISLTNAFGIAASDLASKIEFLNAVENQTVTSIEDLTIAIPKAAPVIKQLGGDVQDLAFFLTAMKEGGINASEGANALKSGLASIINPTEKAAKFMEGFGINLKGLVEANKGDVKGLVLDFASALDTLDPLSKARAIEQLFGKFQFARLSTLFQNVIKEGSQAERVLQLSRTSATELAILAERELKRVEDSPMFKFKKAVEDIKVSLVPLGEAFLKAITPVIEFAKGFLDRFNEMGEGARNFAVIATTVVAGIGPVLLMTFGLIANGVANLIKMFAFIGRAMSGAGKSSMDLGASTDYMTQQQLEAAAVAASLDQAHSRLTQTFAVESAAVDKLATSYARAVAAQAKLLNIPIGAGAAAAAPAAGRGKAPLKLNSGIVSVPGPKGAGDIVPAMLSPGEAVIPAKQSEKYSGLIQGMINDEIPGYRIGRNPFSRIKVARNKSYPSDWNTLAPENSGWGIGEAILRTLTGRRGTYGKSSTTIEKKLSERFLRGRGKKVAVRMFSDDLAAALGRGDKRYQSIFERGGTSRGSGDSPSGQRALAEEKLFGLGPDAPASKRPAYGYLFNKELQTRVKGRSLVERLTGKRDSNDRKRLAESTVDQKTTLMNEDLYRYGDVAMILKNSALRGRTTITQGDSLNAFLNQYPTPAKFGTRNRKSLQQAKTSSARADFFEAQILGGFSFKDIKRIVATEPQTILKLQQAFRDAGISGIRIGMPKYSMMQKLERFVYGDKSTQRLPRMQTEGRNAGQYALDPLMIGGRAFYEDGILNAAKDAQQPARAPSMDFNQRDTLQSAHLVPAAVNADGSEVFTRAQAKEFARAQIAQARADGIIPPGVNARDLEREVLANIDRASNLSGKDQVRLYGSKVALNETELNQAHSGRGNKPSSKFILDGLNRQPAGMFGGSSLLSLLPKGALPDGVIRKYALDFENNLKLALKNRGNLPITESEYHKLIEQAELDAEKKISDSKHREVVSKTNKFGRLNLTPGSPPTATSGSTRFHPVQSLGNLQDAVKKLRPTLEKIFNYTDDYLEKTKINLPREQKDRFAKVLEQLKGDEFKSKRRALSKALVEASKDKDSVRRFAAYDSIITSAEKGAALPKPKTDPDSQKTKEVKTPVAGRTLNMSDVLAVDTGAQSSKRPIVPPSRAGMLARIFGKRKYKSGVIAVPGPKGKGDVVPAMLSPGEAVIPTDMAQKYSPLIGAMIEDSVPGYSRGRTGRPNFGQNFGPISRGELPASIVSQMPPPPPQELQPPAPAEIKKSGGLFGLAAMSKKVIGEGAKRFGTGIVDRINNSQTLARVGSSVLGNPITTTSGVTFENGIERRTDKAGREYFVEQGKGRISREEAMARSTSQGSVRGSRVAGGRFGGAAMGLGMAGSMAGMAMMGNENKQVADAGGMIMGGSMLLSMLPMMMNKVGLIVLGLAAVVGAFVYVTEALKKATKAGLEAGKAMTMTSEKLQSMSEILGTVSASENADRARQDQVTGSSEQKRAFGQEFLQSEAGKGLLSDVDTMQQGGMTTNQISDNVSNQLATAILQGVMTQDQANSIAYALGNELKNYTLSSDIMGNLTALYGRRGENLLKDPLSITMQIQEDSMKAQTEAFDNAMMVIDENSNNDLQNSALALGAAGATIAAAGVALAPATFGLSAAAGLIAGGVVAATAGIVAGVSAFNEIGDEEENNKARGVAVALGAERLAQNQGLIDSLNQHYNQELATLELQKQSAKTEKEKLAIQGQIDTKTKERNDAIKAQMAENSKAFAVTMQQAEKMGAGFSTAIGTAIDEKFKDATGATKQQVELLKTQLNELETTKDGKFNQFKATLQLGLASGELDPASVNALLNAAKTDSTIETNFNMLVATKGAADANQLLQLMMKDGTKPQNMSVIMDYMNKSPDMQADLAALASIADMESKYTLDIDADPKMIEEVRNFQKELSGLPDVVTKQNVQEYLETGKGPDGKPLAPGTVEELKGMLSNWEALAGKDGKINRQVLFDFKVGKADRPAIMEWYKTHFPEEYKKMAGKNIKGRGVSDAEFETMRAAFFSDGGTEDDAATTPDTTTAAPGPKKDDPFKDILGDLKRVRDATIDVNGGMKELQRVLGKKMDINILKGTESLLLARGLSAPLAEYFAGLDDEVQKLYFKVGKNGKLTLTKQGELWKNAFDERAIGRSVVSLQASLQTLNQQNRAVDTLVGLGLDYADAVELAGDAELASAIIVGKNKDEIQKIVDLKKQELALTKKTNAIRAIRTAIADNKTAAKFEKDLQGFSFEEQMAIANSAALQEGIAQGRQNTTDFRNLLIQEIRKIVNQDFKTASDALKQAVRDYLKVTRAENMVRNQFASSSPVISSVILNDTMLMDMVVAAQTAGKQLGQEFYDRLRQLLANPATLGQVFDEGISKAFQAFDVQEKKIELDFQAKTLGDLDPENGVIPVAERAIEELNYKIDDYDAALQQISDKEAAINEKYSNRVKALEEVSRINDRLLAQEQAQLNVADALTRGDVAAAAQAVQAFRAQQVQANVESQREALELAKERELEALTATVNGKIMSRKDIEKEVKALKDQILEIEEKTLEPAERRVKLAQNERDIAISNVTVLGMTRAAWDGISNQVALASINNNAFLTSLIATLSVVEAIKKAYGELGGSTPGAINIATPAAITPSQFTTPSQTVTNAPGSETVVVAPDLNAVPEAPTVAPVVPTNTTAVPGGTTQKPTSGGTTTVPTVVTPTKPTSDAGYGKVWRLVNNKWVATAIPKPTADPGRGKRYEWSFNADKWYITDNPMPSVSPGSGNYWGWSGGNWAALKIPNRPTASPGVGKNWSFDSTSGTWKTVNIPQPTSRSGGGSPGPATQFMSSGGVVPNLLRSLGTDTIPAMLTPGEFVVRKYAVDNFGVDNLKAINSGTYSGGAVYNSYELNVNVKSDANPDQIARAVMTQIKQIDSQRIRGNRF